MNYTVCSDTNTLSSMYYAIIGNLRGDLGLECCLDIYNAQKKSMYIILSFAIPQNSFEITHQHYTFNNEARNMNDRFTPN